MKTASGKRASWVCYRYASILAASYVAMTALVFGGKMMAGMTTAASRDGADLVSELVAKHGSGQRERIERGVRQVRGLWTNDDGDEKAREQFIRDHFVSDPTELDAIFERFETALEQIDGHVFEIGREWRR